MAVNQEKSERDLLLDQGYDALQNGRWQEADQIFIGLLGEDPHCGLSCLGRAMVQRQLHNQDELAQNWAQLCKSPEFQEALSPAKPDFLQWLQKDMDNTEMDFSPSEEEVTEIPCEVSEISNMSAGRKILLFFAIIEVGLYLAVAWIFWNIGDTDLNLANAFLSMVVAAMFTGMPVILGPVYGNCIVEAGRFRKLLKILNNSVAILGGGIYTMISIAGYLSIRESAAAGRTDQGYFMIFLLSAVIHILSLIVPAFLSHVEQV